jgi:hypothetical protein
LILFPPAGIKAKKEIRQENALGGIKPGPAGSITLNTFTSGAGLPPFLCRPAPSFLRGAEREGDCSQQQRLDRRDAMTDKKKDEILYDHNQDGIDRRGFLKCMAWAGTGTFCVIKGGVLKSYAFNRIGELDPADMKGELS